MTAVWNPTAAPEVARGQPVLRLDPLEMAGTLRQLEVAAFNALEDHDALRGSMVHVAAERVTTSGAGAGPPASTELYGWWRGWAPTSWKGWAWTASGASTRWTERS